MQIFTENNLHIKETCDDNDLITGIDNQIAFLKKRGLTITYQEELKHIIINYGFNNLFRKYSPPFLEKKDSIVVYKKNTSEVTILKLYYFDYTLTNILLNYLGSFELKLKSNIIYQINQECPVLEKQLTYLFSKQEQTKFIKKINNTSENGADYLKPFIKNNVYPAAIILQEMTLGEVLFIFNKLQNNNYIFENFYLTDFSKKEFFSINFDFIRPLRNVVAHFNRLFKYSINLTREQGDTFKKFIHKFITNEKYLNQVLDKNCQKLDNFDLILMLVLLLGYYRAQKLVETLKIFIKDSQEKNNNHFNLNNLLTDPLIYDWPQDWEQILDHALENKLSMRK